MRAVMFGYDLIGMIKRQFAKVFKLMKLKPITLNGILNIGFLVSLRKVFRGIAGGVIAGMKYAKTIVDESVGYPKSLSMNRARTLVVPNISRCMASVLFRAARGLSYSTAF